MIIKKDKDYILTPPKGVEGVSKKVAWEINEEIMEIEKTSEKGQVFQRITKFLGLPAINKDAILLGHKEGKKFVRIILCRRGRRAKFLVPIQEWVSVAEEKGYTFHNPKSTNDFCSGYDNQYVLPKILFDKYSNEEGLELMRELWEEIGTPRIQADKENYRLVEEITTEKQKRLFS